MRVRPLNASRTRGPKGRLRAGDFNQNNFSSIGLRAWAVLPLGSQRVREGSLEQAEDQTRLNSPDLNLVVVLLKYGS